MGRDVKKINVNTIMIQHSLSDPKMFAIICRRVGSTLIQHHYIIVKNHAGSDHSPTSTPILSQSPMMKLTDMLIKLCMIYYVQSYLKNIIRYTNRVAGGQKSDSLRPKAETHRTFEESPSRQASRLGRSEIDRRFSDLRSTYSDEL